MRSRFGLAAALEPQLRRQTPIWFKVVGDLPVDGPDRYLHLFVADFPFGVVDNGNDHVIRLL